MKNWKLLLLGLPLSAGLYFVNHRLAAGGLLLTLLAVFVGLVFASGDIKT